MRENVDARKYLRLQYTTCDIYLANSLGTFDQREHHNSRSNHWCLFLAGGGGGVPGGGVFPGGVGVPGFVFLLKPKSGIDCETD